MTSGAMQKPTPAYIGAIFSLWLSDYLLLQMKPKRGAT